jgi:hypothetical protein
MALRDNGTIITHIKRHAEIIPHLADKSKTESAVAEFHNLAGSLPYWRDADVGALILESVADGLPDGSLKEFLYRHALYRARWCASAATAGGEGRSRMLHVNHLQIKQEAQQCDTSNPCVPSAHGADGR